jgi:hypothetical protein
MWYCTGHFRRNRIICSSCSTRCCWNCDSERDGMCKSCKELHEIEYDSYNSSTSITDDDE